MNNVYLSYMLYENWVSVAKTYGMAGLLSHGMSIDDAQDFYEEVVWQRRK